MKAAAAIFALLACAVSLRAQNVRCELLVVRVPQAEGLRLRPILREAKRAAAGVSELLAMIADGKVELIGMPILWTQSGQRAVTETHEEIRYPTEDFPSAGPQNSIPAPMTPELIEYMRRQQLLAVLFDFITVPTAFEVRNVGVTLEIEPMVAPDGRTIEIALVPQHVSFEGMGAVSELSKAKQDWRFQQPQFRFFRTTTSITAQSGEWQLLNASVLRERAPAMEFFLLRVTAFPSRP